MNAPAHPRCNHPSVCPHDSAQPWCGFCEMHERMCPPPQERPQTKAAPRRARLPDHAPSPVVFVQDVVPAPTPRLPTGPLPGPTRRKCIVEAVMAMEAAGHAPVFADVLVVAWARWPESFSIPSLGLPSDHAVRSAIAHAVGEGRLRHVAENRYASTAEGAASAARLPAPQREVVDPAEARALVWGVHSLDLSVRLAAGTPA